MGSLESLRKPFQAILDKIAILASLDSEDQGFLVDIESVYVDFGYPRDMEPII